MENSKNELKKEIEHYEWYISKVKQENKGPYTTSKLRAINRERIKEVEQKLKIAKAKYKGIK